MFYFVGIIFAFLWHLNNHKGVIDKPSLLNYFCLALVWPVLTLGQIWIYRGQLLAAFRMFLDIDVIEIDTPDEKEGEYDGTY